MAFTDPHYFDIRVYAENTDMMGIVYHSNFLCFLERARTEMFRAAGLSLTRLASDDYHFAITESDLRYQYPAHLDDLLRVSTNLASKKSCSLLFDQSIHNQHNTLLCTATIKVVCIDSKMKPKRLPENFLNSPNEEESLESLVGGKKRG